MRLVGLDFRLFGLNLVLNLKVFSLDLALVGLDMALNLGLGTCSITFFGTSKALGVIIKASSSFSLYFSLGFSLI